MMRRHPIEIAFWIALATVPAWLPLVGGYTDLHLKRELLRAEGHQVTRTRIRDFASVRWQPHGRSRRKQESGIRTQRS